MAGYLGSILSGIGMGSTEDRQHGIVYLLASFGVDDSAVGAGIALHFLDLRERKKRTKEPRRSIDSPFSAYSYHSYAALRKRCTYGANGGHIHSFLSYAATVLRRL